MSNANGPKYRVCSHCEQKTLLSGRHSEYNPRSARDGKQICADCKVKELYALALERRD